jgi:hypothetical protein
MARQTRGSGAQGWLHFCIVNFCHLTSDLILLIYWVVLRGAAYRPVALASL